jgi:DMSO/TMAO reductase YedYZ molybdopterin-dependent catalytic subunit
MTESTSMGRKTLQCLAWACLFAAGACATSPPRQTPQGQQRASPVNETPSAAFTIELTGSGLHRPMTLTFEQLARMETVRLDEVLMRTSHGPDRMTSWLGPPFEALLEAASVKAGPMTVTLHASDGYTIGCRREELRSAIMALQNGDGHWLSELAEGCHLRLVVPDKPGNYWITNIRRITVEPVADPQ